MDGITCKDCVAGCPECATASLTYKLYQLDVNNPKVYKVVFSEQNVIFETPLSKDNIGENIKVSLKLNLTTIKIELTGYIEGEDFTYISLWDTEVESWMITFNFLKSIESTDIVVTVIDNEHIVTLHCGKVLKPDPYTYHFKGYIKISGALSFIFSFAKYSGSLMAKIGISPVIVVVAGTSLCTNAFLFLSKMI